MIKNIKCRYGINYDVDLKGSKGAIARTANMLEKCCCFVCHNHNCDKPYDEKIECHNECELYFKNKPCQ